jgi:ubiquinone/menaquinone biosynthesis C-methylase UbiE/uncharacterized membrane protein
MPPGSPHTTKTRSFPQPRTMACRLVLIWLAAWLIAACGQPPESGATYTEGPASKAGTGRYYMNREIAQVMSFRGADWLERTERGPTERTDLVLENLALTPSSVVADIGAGSGYFSRRIAQLVPTGEVIAVDIQPEMLSRLEAQAAAENISNIRTVLAQEKSPNLAGNTIDLALLVDVYHELKWPREVMLSIRDALKPGGKVVLVEYRAEDKSVPIIPIHKMSEAQARMELEAVGFELADNQSFLPNQHFLVFTVAADAADTANLPAPIESPAESQDASEQGDSKLRAVDFRATGNEPPWKLEVGPERIRLKTGYELSIEDFPPANPLVESNLTGYSTRTTVSLLEITITAGGCNDSMSDEQFESAVTIRLVNVSLVEPTPVTLTGCGNTQH